MKKYLIIIIALLIFSCKKDLTGHWHAKSTDYNYVNGSIDIFENNKCYLTISLSSKPIKGEHFPEKKQIFFPGQCGQYSYVYTYKNDSLILTSYLGDKVVATKQRDSCNRFKDFKSKLPIDFLKIKNQRNLYNPKDSIENEGISQYILIDTKNDILRIQFFDKINSIDKIDSIIEYIENSVSDAEIPFVNYILVPDKKLKTSELKLIIDKFNKGSKKKIFLQTLQINPTGFNIFEYLKIDKLELGADVLLEEIIN